MKNYKLKKKYYLPNGTIIEPQILRNYLDLENPNRDYIANINSVQIYQFENSSVETNTEFFEEIIEKPRDILRWDNGAVMEVPETLKGWYKVFYIEKNDNVYPPSGMWSYTAYIPLQRPSEWLVDTDWFFLTAQEAELECEARNIRARLMRKIKEIDRENESEYFGDKCYVYWDFQEGRRDGSNLIEDTKDQNCTMSSESMRYLLDENLVSDREFKLFLGIKNII